jgi:Tfp pilus assembly protein PilW
MALSLILLAIAFSLFDSLNNAADLAGTVGDVNENLRAAMNMVARDVSTAGAGIPQGGVPLPSGGSACLPIQLPLPSTVLNQVSPVVFSIPVQYFNNAGTASAPACPTAANMVNMPVITPGAGYGPSSGSGGTSIPTDSITLITVNPSSNLGQSAVASITPVTTANKGCCFAAGTTSVTITFTAATTNGGNPINGPSTTDPNWVQVVPGQLIMLQNVNGTCLLAVSSVAADSITFTTSDAVNDPLPFNQFPLNANSPTAGTIGNLQTLQSTGNVYPTTYAYQVTMTTYYLDNTTRQGYWMLMKQLGTGAPVTTTGGVAVQSNPPQVVAMGVNVMQFAYSCNTASNCSTASPALDPIRTPTDPSDIRMVNLWFTAIANHPNRKTGTYFTNSIGTTVTDQNLAYYNQY